MNRYIDIDKLKAEIEIYEDAAIDAYNPQGEDADFWHGKVVAFEDLKTIVTSLQQEQPQVADASKMEQPEVDKQEYGPYARQYPKSKVSQEQPNVDLEKEYTTWWNSISGKINVEHIMEWYMHETARHFYELGLNARKEK